MNTGKPTTDSAELLSRIDRFDFDADWTIEELRESLRAEGIDPEAALTTIKSRLAPLYQFKESPTDFPGIAAAAKNLGFGIKQLAEMTGWSEIFLLKLDRRLVSVEGRSKAVASLLAEKLKSAVEPIRAYILGLSLYPAEANFKSDSQPAMPEKQSFEEAVESDPIMKKEAKEILLALRDEE
jgi:hypothetical protein